MPENCDNVQAVSQGTQQPEVSQRQLGAEASELQTSEAAVEYVQRLLNAVTAENGDLRKQLVKYQAADQGGRHRAQQHASSTGTKHLCSTALNASND